MTVRLQKRHLQGSGRAQLRARPLQVLRHAQQQRLAVGHGVVELLEPPFYRIAELYFSSMESLQRAALSMSSNRARSELLLLRSSFFR